MPQNNFQKGHLAQEIQGLDLCGPHLDTLDGLHPFSAAHQSQSFPRPFWYWLERIYWQNGVLQGPGLELRVFEYLIRLPLYSVVFLADPFSMDCFSPVSYHIRPPCTALGNAIVVGAGRLSKLCAL